MSKLGKVLTLIAGVVVGVTAQGHATTVLPLDLKGFRSLRGCIGACGERPR